MNTIVKCPNLIIQTKSITEHLRTYRNIYRISKHITDINCRDYIKWALNMTYRKQFEQYLPWFSTVICIDTEKMLNKALKGDVYAQTRLISLSYGLEGGLMQLFNEILFQKKNELIDQYQLPQQLYIYVQTILKLSEKISLGNDKKQTISSLLAIIQLVIKAISSDSIQFNYSAYQLSTTYFEAENDLSENTIYNLYKLNHSKLSQAISRVEDPVHDNMSTTKIETVNKSIPPNCNNDINKKIETVNKSIPPNCNNDINKKIEHNKKSLFSRLVDLPITNSVISNHNSSNEKRAKNPDRLINTDLHPISIKNGQSSVTSHFIKDTTQNPDISAGKKNTIKLFSSYKKPHVAKPMVKTTTKVISFNKFHPIIPTNRRIDETINNKGHRNLTSLMRSGGDISKELTSAPKVDSNSDGKKSKLMNLLENIYIKKPYISTKTTLSEDIIHHTSISKGEPTISDITYPTDTTNFDKYLTKKISTLTTIQPSIITRLTANCDIKNTITNDEHIDKTDNNTVKQITKIATIHGLPWKKDHSIKNRSKSVPSKHFTRLVNTTVNSTVPKENTDETDNTTKEITFRHKLISRSSTSDRKSKSLDHIFSVKKELLKERKLRPVNSYNYNLVQNDNHPSSIPIDTDRKIVLIDSGVVNSNDPDFQNDIDDNLYEQPNQQYDKLFD